MKKTLLRMSWTTCLVLTLSLALLGCPGAAPTENRATLAVHADLAPAYAAGVAVDAVTVGLSGEGDFQFDLSVDATEQKASGSVSELPLGEYSLSVVMLEGGSTVGSEIAAVSVAADTTVAVTIVVDDGAGDTGGSIEVGLE